MPQYKLAPSTRLVAQGTILENDLILHAGDAQDAPGNGPLSAVLQWEPLTEPGRYRVSLRARTACWGASSLVLRAWLPAGGLTLGSAHGPLPVPIAETSLNGYAFQTPGEWQAFTLDFDVEQHHPAVVGLMYAEPRSARPEKSRSKQHPSPCTSSRCR